MEKIQTQSIKDALVDPFELMTNKMFSIFDRKGILPSVFENTSTSYPYDYYIVTDEKTGKAKQQIFQVPVAGYFKDEIHVKVKNDILRIELTPEKPADNTNKKYVHCGIKKGKVFFEWFIKGLKIDNVKRTIGNGMLTVIIDEVNTVDEYVDVK